MPKKLVKVPGAIYVVLFPRSNTNPSPKYRVADSVMVRKVWDGDAISYGFEEYETYQEADIARSELNNSECT